MNVGGSILNHLTQNLTNKRDRRLVKLVDNYRCWSPCKTARLKELQNTVVKEDESRLLAFASDITPSESQGHGAHGHLRPRCFSFKSIFRIELFTNPSFQTQSSANKILNKEKRENDKRSTNNRPAGTCGCSKERQAQECRCSNALCRQNDDWEAISSCSAASGSSQMF